MADDILDRLFEEGAVETNAAPPAQTTVETPNAPPAETPTEQQAPDGQPRTADGKFASKETKEPAPPVQQDDPEKQPVSRHEFKGYLDEREKRQKAEARAAELERKLQEAQQAQTNFDPSSIQNDPEAIQSHIQGARIDAVFTISEKVARKEHGDEIVDAAKEWGLSRAQQNPAFAAEYVRQEFPIDWAVKQFKRDKILNEIGDDPDAFIEARIAARLAQLGTAPPAEAQPLAASPQPTAPKPPPPVRSISNAPTAGGMTSVPAGPGRAFDAVIK